MKTFIYSALLATAFGLKAREDGTDAAIAKTAADSANKTALDAAIAETEAGTAEIPPKDAEDATKEACKDCDAFTHPLPDTPLDCGAAQHWKEELTYLADKYFWGWVCWKDLE